MKKRQKWLIIASNIFDNYRMKFRSRFGYLDTIHGATHSVKNIDQSLSYIYTVFSEYLYYAGLEPQDLEGKRILEIGPGDNLGVALCFLASGASQVVCIDRFKPYRNEEQESQIYRSLREAFSERGRQLFDAAVNLENEIKFNAEKLQSIYGMGIEKANNFLAAESFGFIVSRAVLMEFPNPSRALNVMDELLRPGGFSIHKVAPLNDYQMFRQYGYHPLEFLAVPDFLYHYMVSDSGKPNRKPEVITKAILKANNMKPCSILLGCLVRPVGRNT